MASLCGTEFDARVLAQGASMEQFELLKALHAIEADMGFVSDVDRDLIFEFESVAICEALRSQLRRRRGGDGEKFWRRLRWTFIAQQRSLLARRMNDGSVSIEDILLHARRGLPRTRAELVQALTLATEGACRVNAWQRVLDYSGEFFGCTYVETEFRDRVRMARATALRQLGGQDNRNIACRELFDLINSPHVSRRQALSKWFEATYEEQQREDMVLILNKIAEMDPEVMTELGMMETIEVYEVLASSLLDLSEVEGIKRLWGTAQKLQQPLALVESTADIAFRKNH